MKFTLHKIILLTAVLSAQVFCSKAFSIVVVDNDCPQVLALKLPTVELSSKAVKSLKKVPTHIQNKFEHWSHLVETEGLHQVRITYSNGFRDKALSSLVVGERSIRLSRGYRAIYNEEPSDDGGKVVLVINISKL